MFSLICLVLSGCICLSSGYSIYHSCRRLSGHLHNSHFNPFKSGKPNHNNRLHYFSYTVIPYSIRGPFCIYLTVCLVVCFFFRLFLVACALSLSLTLTVSLPTVAHLCRFSNVPRALFTQQRVGKKRKKLRRQTLLVFSV